MYHIYSNVKATPRKKWNYLHNFPSVQKEKPPAGVFSMNNIYVVRYGIPHAAIVYFRWISHCLFYILNDMLSWMHWLPVSYTDWHEEITFSKC